MSSVRLKSEFWAAAWLRRCAVHGVPAVLRKRGAAEAGAIFLKIDRLDGCSALYGPAFPGSGDAEPDAAAAMAQDGRLFRRLHEAEAIPNPDAEERMQREIRFDPDLWLLEAEDRALRPFAAIVES